MKKFLFTKQTWYLESNISEAFIPPGDDHVVFFLAQPSFLVDPSPVHVSSRYQNYRACPRAFQLILFFLVSLFGELLLTARMFVYVCCKELVCGSRAPARIRFLLTRCHFE